MTPILTTIVLSIALALGGSVEGVAVDRSLTVVRSSTELDTEVCAILIPTPAVGHHATSELFLNAVAEGDNVHSRFELTIAAGFTETTTFDLAVE